MKRWLLGGCAAVLALGLFLALPEAAPTAQASEQRQAYCQGCGQTVTWTEITEAVLTAWGTNIKDRRHYGHYYLTKDMTAAACTLSAPGKLCLDLNGHTLLGKTRNFFVSTTNTAGVTLNIMDNNPQGGGKLLGKGVPDSLCGNLYVRDNATVNIYGGFIGPSQDAVQNQINSGAMYIARTTSEVNLYGGVMKGSVVSGVGGTIRMNAGVLNVLGGIVLSGTAGTGDCIYVHAGSVNLSGFGRVSEIYCSKATTDVNIVGDYKGTFCLNYATEAPSTAVDCGSGISTESACMYAVSGDNRYTLTQQDQVLVFTLCQLPASGAAVNETWYDTTEQAVEAWTGEGCVTLYEDLEQLTLTRNFTLDLNGHKISTVDTGAYTLTVLDSATDDYSIDDGVYGKIGEATGTIVPLENYLPVSEAEGLSFHRFEVSLKSVSLSAGRRGLYYNSFFAGDEMVISLVADCGTALSLTQIPNAYNLQTACEYTVLGFSGFSGTSRGSRLVNVLSDQKTVQENRDHAAQTVYGRAYVRLTDGTYLFSPCSFWSFQEMTEIADALYPQLNATQQEALLELYRDYGEVMEDWSLPNLARAQQKKAENAILNQRRDTAEAMMRQMSSILWTLDQDVTYSKLNNSTGVENDRLVSENYIIALKAGRVYRGLPYAHGSGSLYGFLSYARALDQRGVYQLSGIGSEELNGTGADKKFNIARLSNDCADQVFWSWATVSPSIKFTATLYMTEQNGCLRVGDYTYKQGNTFPKSTKEICKDNGEQRMFACYALMQKADGMVMHNGDAGHAVMNVRVHVVRNANGTINGHESYAVILEQTSTNEVNEVQAYDENYGGMVYICEEIDKKWSFDTLFSKGYLPVTCQEMVQSTPLPKAEIKDYADTFTPDTLFTGKITANYRISSVTVQIYNAKDTLQQQATSFGGQANMYSFQLSKFLDLLEQPVILGGLETKSLTRGQTYRVVMTARISTGEEICFRDVNITW